MTLSDLFKLIRHYLKLVIALPLVCVLCSVAVVAIAPATYIAKATLLTNGDIALAGGFAQSEAAVYSKNGIQVTSSADTALRTITIAAEGDDYGGCIAAANATVIAAGEDYQRVNDQVSVSVNEATSADTTSLGIFKTAVIALFIGFFIAICALLIIDMIRTPIKSKTDIESASGLPVLGVIPNRDRGERLLANIRFLGDEPPTSIAVIPVGLTGGALTCAELTSAFEHAGVPVSRIKGNPHAEGFSSVPMLGVISIVECSPLSEGMGALYIAKETDVTILCVSEWRDSRKVLSSIVEELKFVKANLGGAVFLTSGYLKDEFFK